jgi:small subunit ribosomal protein S18
MTESNTPPTPSAETPAVPAVVPGTPTTSGAPTGAPARSGPFPRPRSGDHRERRGPGGGGRFRRAGRKPCRFCADKVVLIDFKNVNVLKVFVTDRGKILPRRMTGTCARHQRALTKAVKRARNIAMLPFMVK